MTRACKDHQCSLCFEAIPKGTLYHYETLTPWCHQDNEAFGAYKAHLKCEKLWVNGVGEELGYILPADKNEWTDCRSACDEI